MGKKKKNAEEHTLLFYQVSLLLPLLLPLLLSSLLLLLLLLLSLLLPLFLKQCSNNSRIANPSQWTLEPIVSSAYLIIIMINKIYTIYTNCLQLFHLKCLFPFFFFPFLSFPLPSSSTHLLHDTRNA